MTKLTEDQTQVLKEIPGYVRVEMIERWIRYYRKMTTPTCNNWDIGFVDALKTLEADLNLGVLTNDTDMREC